MMNFRSAFLVLAVGSTTTLQIATAQVSVGTDPKQQVAQVAAVLELTGRFAQYGQQAKAGIEAAVAEAKMAGKSHITVKYYDDYR